MNLPAGFLALRERFLSRLPERLERMRAHWVAVTDGDPAALSELRREAHSLVGAAGLHEMVELARSAARLEHLASLQHTPEALAEAIARVSEAIDGQQSAVTLQNDRDPVQADIALLFQSQDEMASQAALLGGAGYRVSRFDSIEAFEAASTEGARPDLLLLGLQFHDDDRAGIAYLPRLQACMGPTSPVLIVSASRSLELGIAAYRAGAAGVLSKPIAPETLLQRVAEALAGQRRHVHQLLVITTADVGMARFIETLDDPQLAWTFCNQTGEIRATLAATAFDAVILEDAGDEHAQDMLAPAAPVRTPALVSLLRDDPLAAHRPILVFSSSADPQRRARIWGAGAAAVFDASLPPEEFGPMLRAICQAATRGRRNADAAAREQYEHSRQRQALDHHAIISLADASGTLFETSLGHGPLTGFARTELIGSHLAEAREEFAPPEFSADILAHVRNGKVWQGEYRLPGKHDELRWVLGTLVPFLDPGGQPYQYMVIRSDITDRKRSEQALAAAHSRETALAAQIQATLLLPPIPAVLGGVPMASSYHAFAGVAGDFHALIELGPDTFDLLIGDVMGKGVPAALIGAAVKMELAQCLLELQAHSQDNRPPAPSAIIDLLHRRLASRLIALECFATLTYARFDRRARTLTSVGCGHPEILVFGPRDMHEVPNLHPPLGTIANEAYSETTTPWPPGAVALLYSDGLSETSNADGAMLGTSGLKDIALAALAEHRHPSQVAAYVLDATNRHAAGRLPTDDRTLIVVRNPTDAEHFCDLNSHLDAIATLRAFIVEHCASRLTHRDTDRVMLAAVEAFTNIVKHSQSGSRSIRALLHHGQGHVELILHDDGIPFTPPSSGRLPAPEEFRESGYGIPLLHALCEKFEINHALGTNTTRMIFNVSNSL